MSSKVNSPSGTMRPSEFVRLEAAALSELALRLDGAMLAPFTQAVDLLLQSVEGGRRIIVTGIGKSGIIARKIAATLRSTGTQAHFLHAAGVHGISACSRPATSFSRSPTAAKRKSTTSTTLKRLQATDRHRRCDTLDPRPGERHLS
jgi:hypothetical protein